MWMVKNKSLNGVERVLKEFRLKPVYKWPNLNPLKNLKGFKKVERGKNGKKTAKQLNNRKKEKRCKIPFKKRKKEKMWKDRGLFWIGRRLLSFQFKRILTNAHVQYKPMCLSRIEECLKINNRYEEWNLSPGCPNDLLTSCSVKGAILIDQKAPLLFIGI